MPHLMTVMNKHKDLSSPHRDQRRGLREPRPPLRSYLKTSDESLHPELSAAAEMTDPKGQQVQPASPQAPSHPAGFPSSGVGAFSEHYIPLKSEPSPPYRWVI